jgi:hypothetical protein
MFDLLEFREKIEPSPFMKNKHLEGIRRNGLRYVWGIR